ncbi:MAG: hypothetical protein F6K28_32130 [Microcoleus sp. SIO2G3]|nr:hypothetical protein [Microcoleus sp. SIO2G3]
MKVAGISSAINWQLNWREPAQQVQSVWNQQTQRLTRSIEPSQIPEQVQASIERWSSRLEGALTQPIADWLQAHPIFAWGIDHPLLTLGLLLIVLLLLSGLLKAIARFTEQIWIWLLRSPLMLIQWLFAIALQWIRRKPLALPAVTPKQERLTLILQKLETMRQEQDELLQEVRALLAAEDSMHP